MSDDPIFRNKESFNREVEGIRNHLDLSEEAKQRYLNEAYEKAKAKHDGLVAEHQERLEKDVSRTEKEVFSVPMPPAATTAEKIAARSSYRDAAFRVDEVLERTDHRIGSGYCGSYWSGRSVEAMSTSRPPSTTPPASVGCGAWAISTAPPIRVRPRSGRSTQLQGRRGSHSPTSSLAGRLLASPTT
jgi:hypothetical protein